MILINSHLTPINKRYIFIFLSHFFRFFFRKFMSSHFFSCYFHFSVQCFPQYTIGVSFVKHVNIFVGIVIFWMLLRLLLNFRFFFAPIVCYLSTNSNGISTFYYMYVLRQFIDVKRIFVENNLRAFCVCVCTHLGMLLLRSEWAESAFLIVHRIQVHISNI